MSGTGTSLAPIWVAAGVAAAAVAGGAAWYMNQAPEPVASLKPAVAIPAAPTPAPATSPTPVPAPAPDPAPEAQVALAAQPQTEPEEAAASEPVAEPAEAVAPQIVDAPDVPALSAATDAPRLDEVRLDQGGIAVIAGRAAPYSEVVLRVDGGEVARAAADGRGSFATVAILEPSRDVRLLTLAQIDAEGAEIASPDELILAPVRRASAAPQVELATKAPAQPQAPQAPSADTSVSVASSAPEPALHEQATAEEPALQEQAPVEEPVAEVAALEDTAPQVPSAVPDAPVAQTVQAEVDTPAAPAPTPQEDVAALSDVAPQVQSDLRGVSAAPNLPASAAAPVSQNTDAPVIEGREAPLPVQADPEDAPSQIAILRSGPDGVDVVQPLAPTPDVMSQIALDSISYSAAGEVQLSGRAQSDTREVRVYLDNRPVAALSVDETGGWRGDVPEVQSGIYTLRIDEVAQDGKVTSRVETPFKREAPEVLAAATEAEADAPVKAITVQAGATLWAIARERYGDGLLYVQVFEANKDAIRDPDLIYPGQVFELPE